MVAEDTLGPAGCNQVANLAQDRRTVGTTIDQVTNDWQIGVVTKDTGCFNNGVLSPAVPAFGLRVHPQHLDGDAIYHDHPHTKRIEGNPLDVPSGRFTDGAQALAEAEAAMLSEGVIRLEQSATGIELLADAVRITTTLGAVVAKHVVVALPPALATTDLAFTPPLDAMVASVAARTMLFGESFRWAHSSST